MKLKGQLYIQYRLEDGTEDAYDIDADNTWYPEERGVIEAIETLLQNK